MTPLKVGDRVMVYGCVQMHHSPHRFRGGGLATITCVSEPYLHVQFDKAANGEKGGDKVHYQVHPKQCRRLVKKPRRRIYISADSLRILGSDEYAYILVWNRKPLGIESVEFAEVRKKK